MKSHDLMNIKLAESVSRICHLDGQEVCGFGQTVNDHPNSIVLTNSPRECRDEIHSNVLLLPLENGGEAEVNLEVASALPSLANTSNSRIQTLQWIASSLSTNISDVSLDTSSYHLDTLLGENDEILSTPLNDTLKEQMVCLCIAHRAQD